MGSRGFGRPWGQYFGLLVLAVGTVALIYLALTQTGGSDPETAEDPSPTLSTSASPTESGTPTVDPTEPESSEPVTPTDSPSLSTTPPTVPDLVRADFSAGDKLPERSLLVDGGGNETGLALTKNGLTHGDPISGNLAAGLLEIKLESDVQALGFRVRFAAANPGAVTLVGWQSSIAAAVESGAEVAPDSGFRLVATPGAWTLSILDGSESTLAQGTYDFSNGPETFQIVRQGEQVWVIDPTGATTTATDPRVASLAGPWASWGLQETAAGQKPGLIEAVWGG